MHSTNSPKNIQISEFTYSLPDEKIAKYPLQKRDASKLCIYNKGDISQSTYKNLADFIPESSLLVFNNTRVVEARMHFYTENGAAIELFFLEAVDEKIDPSIAMQAAPSIQIKCYIGNAKRWKTEILRHDFLVNGQAITLTASNKTMQSDYYHVLLSWDSVDVVFADLLHAFGKIPLPPYIKREVSIEDAERYQTVFAEELGSVAAPTAGLHFTKDVLESLTKKRIDQAYLTLHVGAGTFKPVTSTEIGGHSMHGEYFEISKETVQQLIDAKNSVKIIAVGTTSTRTLESLYWIGNQLFYNPDLNSADLMVSQWIPYDKTLECSAQEALNAVLHWMEKRGLSQFSSRTQIIIVPGYTYKVIDGIITNFHQPESTLLLLIAALIGENWRKVYQYALENDFRFLSYGDGSLLWKE
jgi:S-adenosylmethionine:tRNA ribosyltransferase-isomerase